MLKKDLFLFYMNNQKFREGFGINIRKYSKLNNETSLTIEL